MPTKATPPAQPHVSRDKQTGNYIVTLTEECFTPDTLNLASSGYFLDVLALSAKQWELNDCEEHNFDWLSSCTDYTLENFDYETAFFAACDREPNLCLVIGSPGEKAWEKSDLQAGAWSALHEPERFMEQLERYTYKLKEQAHECTGDYYTDNAELNKELQDAYDATQKELYDFWLYGDNRNGNGILTEAKKYHGFEEVDYTEHKEGKPATIRIEVTKDWVEEQAGESDGRAPTLSRAGQEVVATISYRAKTYAEAERAKNAARAEEYKKTREYKEKRKQEEEQARRDKLQAMKRA